MGKEPERALLPAGQAGHQIGAFAGGDSGIRRIVPVQGQGCVQRLELTGSEGCLGHFAVAAIFRAKGTKGGQGSLQRNNIIGAAFQMGKKAGQGRRRGGRRTVHAGSGPVTGRTRKRVCRDGKHKGGPWAS